MITKKSWFGNISPNHGTLFVYPAREFIGRLQLRPRWRWGKEFEADAFRIGSARADGEVKILRDFLEFGQQGKIRPGAE